MKNLCKINKIASRLYKLDDETRKLEDELLKEFQIYMPDEHDRDICRITMTPEKEIALNNQNANQIYMFQLISLIKENWYFSTELMEEENAGF